MSHDVLAISGYFSIHIYGSEIFMHSKWQSRESSKSMLCCGELLWIISITRIKWLIGGFSFG